MSKRLKKSKNIVRESLEELLDRAYSLIDNIKARYAGGFGMTDSSIPQSYSDIVSYVTQWLRKCQEVLSSHYESVYVVKEFQHIPEIPSYDPGATGETWAEHLKKRIEYVRRLLEELESDEEINGHIFISCGQREEKTFGQQVANLIKNLTPFTPYFAENQTNLEGLHSNIFRRLDTAVGFIAILHDRGTVQARNHSFKRGSVRKFSINLRHSPV